jgi:uncharacterized protein (DUF2384 family)
MIDGTPKNTDFFELLRTDPEAAVERITTAFRTAAAEAARCSKATQAALEMYGGGVEKTREFMTRSHPLLDGRPPAEVASESLDGLERVLQLIVRS